MNPTDTTNQDIRIEDLNAPNTDEIKGGPTVQIKRNVILKSSVNQAQTDDDETLRGFSLNHNETTVEDEAAETELLDDLLVADEEQVKGGPGSGDYGTWRANFGCNNHNEMTVADEEAETEVLDDLTVENDEQLAGGKLKRIRIGWMNAQ